MQKKSSNLIIIAFIVFIDMLGIGLILPIMPRLIGEIAHTKVSQAAEIGGYLLFCYAFMQFIFAPVVGALSDKFGRRPILLFALLLLSIDYLVMALAQSLIWLFVGRIISGIMGATIVVANSSIADTVPSEQRSHAFGLVGGAGAIGFVLGPAVGGLSAEFGTRLPFAIAAFLTLAGTVIGFATFKETLTTENRRPFEFRRANPAGSLRQALRSPFIRSSLLVLFLVQLSVQAQFSIWPYWGELRFGWTPTMSGWTVSLYGILMGFSQAFLTKPCVDRFGHLRTARYALLFGLPSYGLLICADSTSTVILAIVVGMFASASFPALQGFMSSQIDANAQGEVQGAIASVSSLAAIVGPVLMTKVFTYFSDDYGIFLPGAPYGLAFLLLGLAIFTIWGISGKEQN